MKNIFVLGSVVAMGAVLVLGSGCGEEKRVISDTEQQLVEMGDPELVDKTEGAEGMKKRVEKMKQLKKQLEKEQEASDAQLENMPTRK
jgi:hypothetical protein